MNENKLAYVDFISFFFYHSFIVHNVYDGTKVGIPFWVSPSKNRKICYGKNNQNLLAKVINVLFIWRIVTILMDDISRIFTLSTSS